MRLYLIYAIEPGIKKLLIVQLMHWAMKMGLVGGLNTIDKGYISSFLGMYFMPELHHDNTLVRCVIILKSNIQLLMSPPYRNLPLCQNQGNIVILYLIE